MLSLELSCKYGFLMTLQKVGGSNPAFAVMPDQRKHRGPNPEDRKLFAAENIVTICHAVADYSMLLSKGYAPNSSLKLVGDHFVLTKRQRMALMRAACSDAQLAQRQKKQVIAVELKGKPIVIDGYNLLITIESALSGGVIFIGRDRCLRDLSGVHGSYRKVTETIPAVELIAEYLVGLGVSEVRWLFDSPVSNSGRLKTLIRELVRQHNWSWQVELLMNPDTELIAADRIVVTTDSNILDNCRCWLNLCEYIIQGEIDKGSVDIWLADLSIGG